MTKKRRALIAALPLAIVTMILVVLAMLPPSPGITKANFDRIEMGTTKVDVEALFAKRGVPNIFLGERWEDTEGEAIIRFDHNDKVIDKFWTDKLDRSSEPLFRKLRHCLHLD